MTGSPGARADFVRLEIPALPGYLALVRMVVSATARIDALLDEERIDDLRVIVSEACTNAIEATTRASSPTGSEGEEPGTVAIECRLRPARLEVEVSDRGQGFDVDSLGELPAATDPVRLTIERGLGIPLIQALSDESEIASDPSGTRVRFSLHSAAPASPTRP